MAQRLLGLRQLGFGPIIAFLARIGILRALCTSFTVSGSFGFGPVTVKQKKQRAVGIYHTKRSCEL